MSQPQYATESELISLSITQAAAGRFGNTAIGAMLQAASSVADSYLSGQFVLPLTVWDMSLRLHVCNIAAYYLYCQFGFNPNAPADKLIEERYTRAIEWLKAVSDEKITPQYTDSSGSTATSPAGGPFIISDDPVGFTSRGVTGWPTTNPWNW